MGLSKNTFDKLLVKYLRGGSSSQDFYEQVLRETSHKWELEENAELKRAVSRIKGKNSKLKKKIEQLNNMDIEQVKLLKEGDLATYVSPVNKGGKRQEVEICGMPYEKSSLWYVPTRPKGSEAEGTATLAHYLEVINDEDTTTDIHRDKS